MVGDFVSLSQYFQFFAEQSRTTQQLEVTGFGNTELQANFKIFLLSLSSMMYCVRVSFNRKEIPMAPIKTIQPRLNLALFVSSSCINQIRAGDQDSLVCFGLAQNCYDIYIGCPQSTTLVYANIAENCYSIDRGCMWEMPSLKNFRISTLIEMCERCRQRRDIWLILWERDVDNGDRVAS